MRTSAMAGRLRQMREVAETRPYWQYIHAETRVPLNPRPLHVLWDGMVLRHDDPWWDVYFPPNDWLCSCGVRSLSEADLRRLGKSGPDTAPPIVRTPYLHEGSGVTYDLPEGTGYGWDYMPGDLWERGLVPSALIDEAGGLSAGRHKVEIDQPEPVADLAATARPFTAQLLKEGLTDEDYARAFLKPFGADIGKAVLFTDRAGMRMPIADTMLTNARGEWKATKRGRGVYMALLAETLMDPDEIWLGVAEKPVYPDRKDGPTELLVDRRYIRTTPDTGLITVFEMGRSWWEGVTVYPTTDKKGGGSLGLLHNRRGGKLLWKRK